MNHRKAFLASYNQKRPFVIFVVHKMVLLMEGRHIGVYLVVFALLFALSRLIKKQK
ncbi:hypothetical protein SAMN05192529_101150 [Arachidicoccus rhizosphaerae]|uniref:Uncharacterized protein n=1 Tax=Arachidicoccus rhizosphaerae TaxID=551991 RepID=A0A1H3VHZ8_9BACT|nr:hypothetical protein SAMN05192529_101150 [Arachidicoccus rhizosphaerae]